MEFETLKKDNRKKWIVGVIAILVIASTVFFVSTRANYKTTERLNLINSTINWSPSDLSIMAIKVENASGTYEISNTVPTSGYTLSNESYCEVNGNPDSSIPMEYKDGRVTIGITRKGTKCTLMFDKEKCGALCKQLIAKNEMVHETFTNDDGQLVDTGYRYEGANPKNYVRFNNNELWRIIGVFDVINSETNKTESLVKIIRDESIGNIASDTEGDWGSNDWTQSDLKTILNGQYYNGEDINYTYRNPENSHISSSTVSITGKSINDTARSMIQYVKWNIGGASTNVITASIMYTEERGNIGANNSATNLTWPGYIGLMYASDYGYAVDSTSCSRTTTLSNYRSTSSCKDNNWLYRTSQSQWTLTPCYSNSNSVLIADLLGYMIFSGGYVANGVRPSLYLKSSVQIVDNGKDGSYDHPYDLSLN